MRAMRAGGFNGYGDLQRVSSEDLLRTPAEVIAAVQNNTLVPDAKLNALVNLVKEPVRERGYAKEETMQKFLAAGHKKEQVTELLLGIALKTSNYLDHISQRRLTPPWQARASGLIPFAEKRNTAFLDILPAINGEDSYGAGC